MIAINSYKNMRRKTVYLPRARKAAMMRISLRRPRGPRPSLQVQTRKERSRRKWSCRPQKYISPTSHKRKMKRRLTKTSNKMINSHRVARKAAAVRPSQVDFECSQWSEKRMSQTMIPTKTCKSAAPARRDCCYAKMTRWRLLSSSVMPSWASPTMAVACSVRMTSWVKSTRTLSLSNLTANSMPLRAHRPETTIPLQLSLPAARASPFSTSHWPALSQTIRSTPQTSWLTWQHRQSRCRAASGRARPTPSNSPTWQEIKYCQKPHCLQKRTHRSEKQKRKSQDSQRLANR